MFSFCDGIGPKTFLKLINEFGSAKDAWEKLQHENSDIIREKRYEKFKAFQKTFDLQDYLQKLRKAQVKVVGYTSQFYPEPLKQLSDPPIVLFCKGNLNLLGSKQTIGVVGARKITSYGREVTEKLVFELTQYDFTIVSGLAFGVDATAHKKAIDSNGKTIAVLGCGVDCCTPYENQGLYEQILDKNGLIISQYPLGMPPTQGTFPSRNRIIAGLSLGVLITEAAEDSGSLITAEDAVKLGRPVFAVPGPINSLMSKGALKLLKQGAKLVSTGEDILEALQIKTQRSDFKTKVKTLKLSAPEKKIVELLESEPLPLDFLSKQTKIPMVKLMVTVSSLEMRGILKAESGEISLRTI